MTYSLNRPPAGMTGFLLLIWPLIFVQLVALKAWVRKHYGPGVPYWYTVSRWGKVSLRHMTIDFTRGYTAPGSLRPDTDHRNLFAPARLLLEALAPEAISNTSLPGSAGEAAPAEEQEKERGLPHPIG